MMKEQILKYMDAECLPVDTLHWHKQTGSTNQDAKALAMDGAPHGTTVMAQMQTAGRGRMGRSFLSPQGGIYMSVILRPKETAQQLIHLTCAVAVAVCDALEESCGMRPQVKWINDLVWQKKKLGGILTELALRPDGSVDYAIIGIGINCAQVPADVQDIACSLRQAAPYADFAKVAAVIMRNIKNMDLSKKAEIMNCYRANCLTLGQQVVVLRGDTRTYGTAESLDEDGGLIVLLHNGSRICVNSGEISVRGMYGYV